jgi:hypothetical protein
VVPSWSLLSIEDVEWDDPKGFSSFTMAIRCLLDVDPSAVFYRGLEGKENAILDFATERGVFLLLGECGIAARCLHYGHAYRIEEYHDGRTLTPEDLTDPSVLKGIASELPSTSWSPTASLTCRSSSFSTTSGRRLRVPLSRTSDTSSHRASRRCAMSFGIS